MSYDRQNIISLLKYVKIDHLHVICCFACDETDRTILSKVPFEPYTGKISLSYMEMLLHPLKSYRKYYHTPITIYGKNSYDSVVLRAFEQVSNHFTWNEKQQKYEYFKE